MVDLYVALIINKRRVIGQIPTQFRKNVMTDLAALGLDGNGDTLPVESIE